MGAHEEISLLSSLDSTEMGAHEVISLLSSIDSIEMGAHEVILLLSSLDSRKGSAGNDFTSVLPRLYRNMST